MQREDRPLISDDMLFEALLKQGCSAEKAARIAHAHDPLSEPDEPPSRASPTKEDLVAVLRKG